MKRLVRNSVHLSSARAVLCAECIANLASRGVGHHACATVPYKIYEPETAIVLFKTKFSGSEHLDDDLIMHDDRDYLVRIVMHADGSIGWKGD